MTEKCEVLSQDIIDEKWMQYALRLAQHAESFEEVPVGAVLVKADQVIGEGWNQPISSNDPTAHAEIMALRQGAQNIKNYRLHATLYVTLEPCLMCLGAIVHARIERLVFGAFDPRTGAVVSALPLINHDTLNHRIDWQGGVLAEPCGDVIRRFFQKKRGCIVG